MDNTASGLNLKRDERIALFLAVLVHATGVIGIRWVDRDWFTGLTSANLLLMLSLVVWTQPQRDRLFLRFLLISFLTGLTAEIIGVNTGILFGAYRYGDILGPGIAGVPFIIGVNWFTVVFCSTQAAMRLSGIARDAFHRGSSEGRQAFGQEAVPVVAAAIATFFDWVMEPVAVELGFWTWSGDGSIPFFNYLCWFLISMGLSRLLYGYPIRGGLFPTWLLIIQLLFFIILRIVH